MAVKRIDKLTKAQQEALYAHADHWIGRGLACSEPDWSEVEQGISDCYRFANLGPPKVVVRVPNPFVGALAFPIASLLLARVGQGSGAVRGAVDGAVGGQFRRAIQEMWHRRFWGQFWQAGWWWGAANWSFYRDVCKLELEGDLWDRARAWERANSVGWWWPHKDFVMVCERPNFIRREQVGPRGWGSHRLHCEDGPAIGWEGWELYFWHGLQVPAEAFTVPGWLNAERITKEPNAELRRAYMEMLPGGQAEYLKEAGGELLDKVHEPPFPGLIDAELWRMPNPDGGEPFVCVLCRNSTREPDGTFKRYSLWVHPELRPLLSNGELGQSQELTAHNALASTFGERGETYAPAVET